MAGDLELQSTQALSLASDQLYPFSNFHLLPPPSPPSTTSLNKTVVPGNRQLLNVWRRLHLSTQSFDVGFGVQRLEDGRTKISVPILPVPKPTGLSMILKAKGRKSLKRNQSEAGLWLHPRVPSTLVNYLLEKQLKKTREGCQRLYRKPPIRLSRAKALPPLKGLQHRGATAALHRSKSSVR